MNDLNNLNKMFSPKTVALVGATDREGSLGRAILENLSRSGRQKIFPVNPNREAVLGIRCHPSVGALPEPVDLAVIAVRAALAPQVVEECGLAGVGSVVIISAGLAQYGEEGGRLEEKVAQSAAAHGVRVVGPASFGVIRPEIGLNASFLRADPRQGNIAFVAQGGQLGNAVLEWGVEARIGFSMFASLGAMVDVDFGDVIDFLGNDTATRSILLDMERVVNARKFISSARGFARSKPIIVMKSGRFAGSAKAGAAGDDRVYSAAFKRVGVVRVREAKDLFNAVQVLNADHLPAGGRVAVICNAGTAGTMAADALLELGGTLAELSPGSVKALVPPPRRAAAQALYRGPDPEGGKESRTVSDPRPIDAFSSTIRRPHRPRPRRDCPGRRLRALPGHGPG